MRTHLTKRTIVGGTAVLALLGIGGGIAVAESTDSVTDVAAASTQTGDQQGTQRNGHAGQQAKHKKHGKKGALLRRVEHGSLTLGAKQGKKGQQGQAGKGEQTVLVQRGVVESINGSTMTVRSKDGFQASYTVNDKTKVHANGKKGQLSDIKKGEQVGLTAVKSGDTATVRAVREVPAKK